MINKAVIREYKVINVLLICQKLKKNVALWTFNMGVNGKILKCAISWKRLIVERNEKKWNSGSYVMSDYLSSVWGHLVHFAKCAMLKIFKRLLLPQFLFSFNQNCYKYVGHDGIDAITFLAICQNLNILWHFKIFVNTGLYGAGNFKTLLLLQF